MLLERGWVVSRDIAFFLHFFLSVFLLCSAETKRRYLFFSVARLNQRRVSRWLMSTTENGVPSNGCYRRARKTARCLSWLRSEASPNGDRRRIERQRWVHMSLCFNISFMHVFRLLYFILNLEKLNRLTCCNFFYLCVFRWFDQEARSRESRPISQTSPPWSFVKGKTFVFDLLNQIKSIYLVCWIG